MDQPLYRSQTEVPRVTGALDPKLREALERLRDYTPEVSVELKDPPCSECGWEKSEHAKVGEAVADHEFKPGPSPEVPFFTESYLYDLMGKEDARTILALVRNVLRAVGLPEEVIRDYI